MATISPDREHIVAVRREGEEVIPLHNCRFSPSEDALPLGAKLFYEYVMKGHY